MLGIELVNEFHWPDQYFVQLRVWPERRTRQKQGKRYFIGKESAINFSAVVPRCFKFLHWQHYKSNNWMKGRKSWPLNKGSRDNTWFEDGERFKISTYKVSGYHNLIRPYMVSIFSCLTKMGSLYLQKKTFTSLFRISGYFWIIKLMFRSATYCISASALSNVTSEGANFLTSCCTLAGSRKSWRTMQNART